MHTIELDDELFETLETRAQQLSCTPQDVIRKAIHGEELPESKRKGHSVLDRKSTWKGGLIRPWKDRAEMLEGFFDRDDDDRA